ncbi:MAG: FAD-dependent oxidoreductase [Pikeienuella sp.]
MSNDLDILVVGGGVAGLTATVALAHAGWQVLCVDQAPEGAGANDTRTTAFLGPAVDLLRDCGVWGKVAADIAPLNTMRLIDAGGETNEAREIADFDATEIAPDAPGFGWNVPNIAIRAAVRKRIDEQATATLRHGVGLETLTPRRDHMIVRLTDGTMLRPRLVIGADGRESAVRKAAGIGVQRWRYEQKALVFSVDHEAPHLGVSTEIHRTGGPFTLVPMPDRDGVHRSSIVWMDHAQETTRLAGLPEAAFIAEMNERSLGVLGRLSNPTARAPWPMMALIADRLTAPRVALIAEAAHVVPPIGAQGLNMSLGDIASLRTAIAGGDPGRAGALKIYQRRWPELRARVAAIDALNRAAMTSAQPLRDLRRAGLSLIATTTPVRRAAMRLGLGVTSG